MVRKIAIAILMVLGTAAAQTKAGDAADPAQVLARAREVMGFGKTGGAVVHMRWITAVLQPYQSDRMYPPFFSMMLNGESWFDPETGVERTSAQMMFPGGPMSKPSAALGDAATRFMFRPTGDPVAVPPDDARNLNAWLVVADWAKARDARYVGRETFRDYPRIVLARQTDDGEQRLLLDPKTGFPVKLEYEASHYLWGQQKIQFIYSNWQQSGAIFTANSAFRMADEDVETSRTAGDVELMARDAAPSLALPATPQTAIDKTPMFLRPLPPKTVDVSANVKVLSNPGYREGIVAVGDEVYVLDATQGEERARQDQEIIRKLYPTAKKINVVVTDLAWPHVSGLRYWVANGATVISHPAARAFLQQVLDRRWTRKPDAYERARRTAKLKFVGVDKAQDFAGGKIRLFPIDGIGSEVALLAYVPEDRFLWASDYIQTLSEPSMYAAEVMAAVQRENVQPQRVAAEHLNLTEWANVVAAQEVKTKSAAGSQ